MSGLENAALLALVAIVPLVVLTLTSFVKLSVVLSLLRNAIGAPDAPSGLVITGLSLVLTFFVMAPVAVQMVQAAGSAPTPAPVQPAPHTPGPAPGTLTPGAPAPSTPAQATPPADRPASPGSASAADRATAPAAQSFSDALHAVVPTKYEPQLAAAERAVEPLRAFLARHTRDADRETFASLARKLGNVSNGDELWVLAPAFITTELREAFVIAILIFIPFLVIDLVVGLSLASLGLQATSPQTVALPLKLVLFVAVDGWRLLLEALLRGYA
jgi:type III secretion protein R